MIKVKQVVGSSVTCTDLKNIQKKGHFSPGIDEKQLEQRLEQNNYLNRRLQMDPV